MTFGPGPAKRVELPLPQPPSVCLLTAAPNVVEVDLRWANAYEFLARGNGASGGGVVLPDSTAMTPGAVPGKELWRPFLVYAGLTDSAFDYEALDWTERVTNNLLLTQSDLIEEEVWTNSTAQAPVNLGGAGSGAVDITGAATGMSPGKALAALVGEWANRYNGIRGYIHTSAQAITLMAEARGLHREGNVWLTADDQVIVLGRGYVLDGPAGQSYSLVGTEWAYITATPYVRLGPIEIIPPSFPGSFMQATHRDSNDVTIYAGRLASVSWDTSVPTLCVPINKTL